MKFLQSVTMYRLMPALLVILIGVIWNEPGVADKRLFDGSVADRGAAILSLYDEDLANQLEGLDFLDGDWNDNVTPALLEYISLTRNPALRELTFELLRNHTGEDFGYDLNAWFSWAWKQNLTLPPEYPKFKAGFYKRIDPRFEAYFSAEHVANIRLDEVRWGGVLQDGIPPLRGPQMISAADAEYLDDDNVVFGLEVNGDARAYPKRILAWHEMFVDDVGGIPVVGVYCTLCGSMILYESNVGGTAHEMGTSGFLYRSNKLMYDKATQSLWNTMWGTPAIGPLVDKGIRLPRRTVVTTTWGEWRRRHPDTSVLSLNTGYQRDYDEGVAYHEYFSTDALMFNTSQVDTRLANKAEVLGLTSPEVKERPLAISASYAKKHPIVHERIGNQDFVVLTDLSGAMRVYATEGQRFRTWDRIDKLRDTTGAVWTLQEDQLISRGNQSLPRLPSHNAFWFGWYGAYTNTRLLF